MELVFCNVPVPIYIKYFVLRKSLIVRYDLVKLGLFWTDTEQN